MRKLFFALLLCTPIFNYAQKFQGLALTPPMGWISSESFQTNIDERLVMDMADALVLSGMKDAGYTYLILNEGWMAMSRDEAGNLVADPKKFPRGIKVISDYVHAKGLRIGLCNSVGTKTCLGYPGTRGYEFQDARLYASWEIDYLKLDWCYCEGLNPKEAYTTMSHALRAAGRPVVLSLCESGTSKPWEWAKNIAHLWCTGANRLAGADPATMNQGSSADLMEAVGRQAHLNSYAGPGYWNDPALLRIGNEMRLNEARAHFSLWCMSAAPLIAANDLRRMTNETRAVLINKELIAIDQDSLGIQAFKFASQDSVETWFKPLKGGDWAACFFNRSTKQRTLAFNWRRQEIRDTTRETRVLNANKFNYHIRDLWKKKSLGTTVKPMKAMIAPQDVLMVRLSR